MNIIGIDCEFLIKLSLLIFLKKKEEIARFIPFFLSKILSYLYNIQSVLY